MAKALKTSDILATGLMTFALFLGAGNIIFPPMLGHMAGDQLILAILGFLLTGVGLPLLGVIACAKVGGGLDKLTNLFPKKVALVFSVILFAAIGPLFASPRTAVVSYELGLLPFIGEASSASLAGFSVVFFSVVLYLALFPGKLLDAIGKYITPMLVAVLALIALGVVFFPQGPVGIAAPELAEGAFFSGFREGYQTMDTLGALVFGVVIINAIHSRGVTEKKLVARYALIAGLIASVGLSVVYLVLGYMGSTSHQLVADPENGAQIISLFVEAVFGGWGKVLLAATVIIACLTTAVGLMSACGSFFSKVFPALSYKFWVIVCTLVSTMIANVGLNVLLAITIPALLIIYPIAIALIVVTLLRDRLQSPAKTMTFVLLPVGFISLIEGLNAGGVSFVESAANWLTYLPLQAEGLVWLLPGILGGALSLISSSSAECEAAAV